MNSKDQYIVDIYNDHFRAIGDDRAAASLTIASMILRQGEALEEIRKELVNVHGELEKLETISNRIAALE